MSEHEADPPPPSDLEARRAELRAREPEAVDERIAAAWGRLGRAVGIGCALAAFVPSIVRPGKDVMFVGSLLFFVPVGLAIAIYGTLVQRRGVRQAEARRAWENELRKLDRLASREASEA